MPIGCEKTRVEQIGITIFIERDCPIGLGPRRWVVNERDGEAAVICRHRVHDIYEGDVVSNGADPELELGQSGRSVEFGECERLHVLVHEFMSIYYALAVWSGNRERRDERTKRKREKEKGFRRYSTKNTYSFAMSVRPLACLCLSVCGSAKERLILESRTIQRMKHCRCEVSHESVATTYIGMRRRKKGVGVG
ncbi:hypothetical protein EVAR_26885_1 [Eumeta japonica]|uniref:Uncharacterized protein n=1 Tax=Eumeta variegata TaxID=151549 RepID=A0A4C1VVE5_EUMVA|nr:hypothetical protein EVAR_26885_1 [Eumeta japonica]